MATDDHIAGEEHVRKLQMRFHYPPAQAQRAAPPATDYGGPPPPPAPTRLPASWATPWAPGIRRVFAAGPAVGTGGAETILGRAGVTVPAHVAGMTAPAQVGGVWATPTSSPVSALVPAPHRDQIAFHVSVLEDQITGITEVLDLTPPTGDGRGPASGRIDAIENKLDELTSSVDFFRSTVDALQRQKKVSSSDDGSFCNISEKNPGS